MGKREREYDPARTLRRMRNFVVAVLLAVLAWLLLSRAYAALHANRYDGIPARRRGIIDQDVAFENILDREIIVRIVHR